MNRTASLNPEQRTESLAALQQGELDVLVIGGGVTGAGCAVDAATRGLSVGVVEMRDWAAGTSSRSSKLIHGGLRYLEMFDFALVREALQERSLMLTRLAPHLVRPVPFLYPLKHRLWERPYVAAGLTLYDQMAHGGQSAAGVPRHRHLTRKQARRECASLRKDAFVGAVQYYDAQVDDARHTMMLVRTAVTYGAHAVNRAQVTGFLREGERVVGARILDLETGQDIEVRARQVVNATGVWTDDTQSMIGERGQFKVRASKGIHVVVPKDRIQSTTGLILRTEKSVLFVIPWGRHWIIGTTDTDWQLGKAHPAASSADIDYLLDEINQVLVRPLSREDVEGVYAGLRPLLAGESDETSQLSREHIVAHPVPGLVVVAGGKYTTYRVMAKDAIDEVSRALPFRVSDSCTASIPVVGAEGYRAMWNRRHRTAAATGVHVARIEHLLQRYGSLTEEVLQLVKADPHLGKALSKADDYLAAEVVYAVTAEGARHVSDVLVRRTRVHFEAWDRGVGVAEEVAELMAPLLGWSQEQVDHEVQHYVKRVELERSSQSKADDAAADATLMGAPDIVPVHEERRDHKVASSGEGPQPSDSAPEFSRGIKRISGSEGQDD